MLGSGNRVALISAEIPPARPLGRRLQQLKRDAVGVVEVARKPSRVRTFRDPDGRVSKHDALLEHPLVPLVDVGHEQRQVCAPHAGRRELTKIAAARRDVFDELEHVRRPHWRNAGHGELRDLEYRPRNADEDRRVFVLLALTMNELKPENARVPVHRALDIAHREREVQDAGDHAESAPKSRSAAPPQI